MKIYSAITMSGDVSMASTAKDRFTIGSELERDNANADVFTVWANSNFHNDVTLGSSSIDLLTINAGTISVSGSNLLNTSNQFFVNAISGSDSNSGLASEYPLQTISAAIKKVGFVNNTGIENPYSDPALVLSNITINIASGTYIEDINIIGKNIISDKNSYNIKFVGATTSSYTGIAISGSILNDKHTNNSDGIRGVSLTFSGSNPAEDTLIGKHINFSNGGYKGLIVSNSGSNIYFVSNGYADVATFASTGTVDIFENTTIVSGSARIMGSSGGYIFNNIKFNLAKPATKVDYFETDSFSNIYYYNCDIIGQEAVQTNYIFGGNIAAQNTYFSASSNPTSYFSQGNGKLGFFAGCFFDNFSCDQKAMLGVSYAWSAFKGCSATFTDCQNITQLPIKLFNGSGIAFYGSKCTNEFPLTFVSASGITLTKGSTVIHRANAYWKDPAIVKPIYVYDRSFLSFPANDKGQYFTGSCTADKNIYVVDDSYLYFDGNNVQFSITSSNPIIELLNSKLIFNNGLPLTASISGNAEYPLQLDDVSFLFSNLPVSNGRSYAEYSNLRNNVDFYFKNVNVPSDKFYKINSKKLAKWNTKAFTTAGGTTLGVTGSRLIGADFSEYGEIFEELGGLYLGRTAYYGAAVLEADYIKLSTDYQYATPLGIDLINGNGSEPTHITINNKSNGGNIYIKSTGADSAQRIYLSGSTDVSGTLTVKGDIVPEVSGVYTLGTSEKPFKGIYVGSGSVTLNSEQAGIQNVVLGNVNGGLSITASNVTLTGTGSFVGSGYGLYGLLGANIKHTYDFLTSSGQTASAGTSVVYLNDGNNADYGLPDITNHDGIIIFMKNLKNTTATIHPYGSQKINDVAGTHNVAGNGHEAFHAISHSSGITWYTMYSS